MTREDANKLQEHECVLLGAVVQKPSCGKVEEGSMLDKFGALQLSTPNDCGYTVLRVLPEQVVSRYTVRQDMKEGDIVMYSAGNKRGVGAVIEVRVDKVRLQLYNNCFAFWFNKQEVSLIFSVEEVQDRVERALAIAAKKRAYAKGGLPAVENRADNAGEPAAAPTELQRGNLASKIGGEV